jgi:hypothetical protein
VTLRLAAAVALAIGVTTLAAYFHIMGVAPWSPPADQRLRAMKERAVTPPSATPLSLDSLARLPRRAPIATRASLEARGVTIEGYVQRMLRAVDGDIHLDVVPRPPRVNEAFPYVVAELTPAFRRAHRWTYDRLAANLRPPRGSETPWEDGPARVRLTGWLFYDEPHEVRPSRPRYADALSAWEVHPVTRIEIWNDESRRYEEAR